MRPPRTSTYPAAHRPPPGGWSRAASGANGEGEGLPVATFDGMIWKCKSAPRGLIVIRELADAFRGAVPADGVAEMRTAMSQAGVAGATRQRAVALYTFLKEFTQLRSKTIRMIDQYEQVL